MLTTHQLQVGDTIEVPRAIYEITFESPTGYWTSWRIQARDFHAACEKALSAPRHPNRLLRVELVP